MDNDLIAMIRKLITANEALLTVFHITNHKGNTHTSCNRDTCKHHMEIINEAKEVINNYE